MNTRSLILIGSCIAVVIIGAVGWYLISPSFVDTTVDEAFPFETPAEEPMAEIPEAEKEQTEADSIDAIPSETEIAQMPEAQSETVATNVEQTALITPDHETDEPMASEVETTENKETEKQDIESQDTETKPTQPVVIQQGQFQDADSSHQGSGSATVYQLPDGAHLLRFDEFSVTNGPALHVFLATNETPTDHDTLGDYLDLGSLKGNVGNQNYEIPPNTDVSQYKSVVIYCVPFQVVFATATLQ